MKLRKLKAKILRQPVAPHDTGSCLRATIRRQRRSEARKRQPGPNPTDGPNRAFRRHWQPGQGPGGIVLLRVRNKRLEYKRP